jgi:hypothetical protein
MSIYLYVYDPPFAENVITIHQPITHPNAIIARAHGIVFNAFCPADLFVPTRLPMSLLQSFLIPTFLVTVAFVVIVACMISFDVVVTHEIFSELWTRSSGGQIQMGPAWTTIITVC